MNNSFCYKSTAIFIMLFIINYCSVAQGQYFTISGIIKDSETAKPLPFATVGLAGESIGTVSNEDGAFIIKLPSEYRHDSLKISFIGYQTYIQPVSKLINKQVGISLKPATVALDEVLVEARRKSAVDIIKEAVEAIPVNYDTSATQLMAFYREDTKLEDYEITFVEAVLEVTRPSYASKELEDQIKTIKERRKKLDHSKDLQFYLMLTLGGGAKNAIRSGDFIRFFKKPHKHSILNEKNLRHYEFILRNVISDGQKNMYVIEVHPKKKSRKAFAHGTIYLEVQTLAFVRWEFESTQNGLDLENNRKKLLKKVGSMVIKADLKLSYFKEVYNFENYGDKWYVKDVQRNFEAIVNSKSRSLENARWTTNLFLTTTEINKTGSDPSQKRNIFSAEGAGNPESDSDAFWENFNIILPASLVKPGEFKEYTDSTYYTSSINEEKPRIPEFSNRENGFTRADTLRGKLTPLRTCYDVTFYDLDVRVDIDNKFISGSNKIRFAVKEPFSKMQVDLYDNMKIHEIIYEGRALSYTREFNAVFVEFPDQLKQGTEEEITVFYSGTPQVPDKNIPMHGGFLWEKDQEGNPWVQVVCQGSGASLWWPNKDHLSDEPDSVRISVTVPQGLMNISNGRLRNVTELPDGLTKYEWYVSYPINNYNVTLNIGKYAHQQDLYVTEDTLTLDYYFMPYNSEKAKIIFEGVKPMLSTLESHYGKYPFPNDGFKLLESLYPMEHQSAVTLGKIPDHEIKETVDAPMGLIWHETAHEWWGNNVSCKDMADMWIHEAFATYSEMLYMVDLFGPDARQEFMNDAQEQVLNKEPIIGVYDVNHIHYNIEDMYGKGALVLNTFRNVLNNDTLWADILLGIQQDFKYQTITTDDLVNYINTKTKADYTYFFDQYLKHASLPKLMVKITEKGKLLTVQYKWSADVQGFCMPVHITTRSDHFETIYPTAHWQTITLPDLSLDDFEVDQEKFYIDVEMTNL